MAAYAMARYNAKTTAAVILTMIDKLALVIHEEGFWLPKSH